jgi:NADH-quinone oxidoreductase subunit J
VTHPIVLAASGPATTRSIAFWLLAIISVAAGLGMVLARRAVHCAVLLAVVMLSLAVFYAMLGAPFLAFVQVIVYTGAVLMLFLFVMMIVGITSADSLVETIRGQRLAAGLAGIGLLVLLALIVGNAVIGPEPAASTAYSTSNINGLATLIFTTYVFPFEVTSALLITAALGAMVLAHRERTSPKPTQRSLSRQRVASGRPGPLPGPGTYARHNAVDMPALLPDGSAARTSVSPVLSFHGGASSLPAGREQVRPAGDAAGYEAGPGAEAGQQASAPAGGDAQGGGDTPAGDTPAGDTPAGDTPAGDTPAGDTPAGPGEQEARW